MLAVNWRLFRCSGSVESKYGPLYWRLAGTPATPRERNGESTAAVLVPPAFSSFQYFCEYCAVANVRDPSTPRHVSANRRFGVDGVVKVAGSMLCPSDGCRRSVWLSMNVP